MDDDKSVVEPAQEYSFLTSPQRPDELGRLAHFRVIRLLGRGGMGLVFDAEDTLLQRPVALKVMRPEIVAMPHAAARFLREARAAAAIKHEHVVTVYEAGHDRGVPYLAMERLQGNSLQECLKERGRLAMGQVVEIGLGIAVGLSSAHDHGLVHRDIKPSNIWLEAPLGRVKILDYGLARAIQSESGLTSLGTIIGSPQYMAPEQALLKSEIGLFLTTISRCGAAGLLKWAKKTFKNTAFLRTCVNQIVRSSSIIRGPTPSMRTGLI
jgi:serine/threonine protein kinase